MNNQKEKIEVWLEKWPEEIRSLISRICLELGYNAIHLDKHVSGRSGAKTYLAIPESAVGTPNMIVIKIGNAFQIGKDIDGSIHAGNFFNNKPIIRLDISEGAIRCIVMELTGGREGITFENYYLKTDNYENITEIINIIFENSLNINNLNPRTTNLNAFKLYEFDNPSKINNELIRLGDDLPGTIHWINEAKNKCDQDPRWNHSKKMLVHGDLHSRNLIISNKIPFIIDFGLTGVQHLWRDIAKLEREIRLFLYLTNCQNPDEDSNKLNVLLENIDNTYNDNNINLKKAFETIKCIRRFAIVNDIDWEFNYNVALLYQFIFAACNEELNINIRQNAVNIVKQIKEKLNSNGLNITLNEQAILEEKKLYLNRIAYAFFKLDQLPKGGWGKTLANWMEAIWEGDLGNIPRNPGMRYYGGVDLTTYAFYHYYKFLKKIHNNNAGRLSNEIQPIARLVFSNISSQIGFDGAVGLSQSERAAVPVKIRHTAMGIITFLLCRNATMRIVNIEDELKLTSDYLINHINLWRQDTAHDLALYAALIKLNELLETNGFVDGLKPDLLSSLDRLNTIIKNELLGIENRVTNPNILDLKPENTFYGNNNLLHFRPYGNFWRMETSNLLMNLPYFIKEDENEYNSNIRDGFKNRLIAALFELLNNGGIGLPFNQTKPENSLVYYHRDPNNDNIFRYRDWGLSAELLSILNIPLIQRMVITLGFISKEELKQKKEALENALLFTFDKYHKLAEIFKYTTSVSFFRYLNSSDLSRFPSEFNNIENKINTVLNVHNNIVTESGLQTMLTELLINDRSIDIDVRSVKDMLVNKLESGEHMQYCLNPNGWKTFINNNLKTSTIAFYDNNNLYSERYKGTPITTIVTRLRDVTDWDFNEVKTALDLGCGPGQYAKLLQDIGFDVTLFDASHVMLNEAQKATGINKIHQWDIYNIDNCPFIDKPFDLIFACAMMIHIPKEESASIYHKLFDLLKPGGLLFVNYKIGDHTIISVGDRFFEYYNSHLIPQRKIEAAGFSIEEITFRWNKNNLYNDPKSIYWANFYCKKPNGN